MLKLGGERMYWKRRDRVKLRKKDYNVEIDKT
jgi:hypothetical protein